MKRIAALVPNVPGVSPGQRVRIETWSRYLEEAGWSVNFYPFEDARLHEVLYKNGQPFSKIARLTHCYINHLRRILKDVQCDVLFIYREAALLGPALIERLATRLKVPIIYDVDDPVFLPYRSPMNGWFSLLKFSKKTHAIFRLSSHVIAINRLIADYAAKYNRSVSVIPNGIDIELYHPVERASDGAVRIVWMGSHSTMANLNSISQPLRRLLSEGNAQLRIIGAGQIQLPGINPELHEWSPETEIVLLQDCDIGLVPVPDLAWNRWKFFYKTVQYMALGIPVIARRIGSNSEIIQDGVNGFLVETQEEWYDRLALLTRDSALRQRMGGAARKTIIEKYSIDKQAARVVSLFEQVLNRHLINTGQAASEIIQA
jgi:glycosyltransferase involved in cell wall biosynthesis